MTVNGTALTDAQVVTLRVALCSFRWKMGEPNALGDDDHGRFMVQAYRDRIDEMLAVLDAPEKQGAA